MGKLLFAPSPQEPIRPLEKRALNFLVNEYLLKNEYKLSSITFSDENDDQVKEVGAVIFYCTKFCGFVCMFLPFFILIMTTLFSNFDKPLLQKWLSALCLGSRTLSCGTMWVLTSPSPLSCCSSTGAAGPPSLLPGTWLMCLWRWIWGIFQETAATKMF